ncbi:SUMF1/EgtB/PvdO family nonheme iron enzyme [Phototrophicus methaneseepsis]|uniref:SUMF1/EgtB/PvdO family nonheme iron enzyme n=1 Tax=Phototrophicus methaneseepsis TaxID=2710758 RepID=A0A7S8IG49_9CHLR|nr:SUMF1/EgtB/PvdO family nonheme iron enzyme [Phototrophicus methaneseepsis]QPC83608.1 SUMF1/EgtB/PvdO family nonheme iron enzyme [Phototrophicus methaneseepsis]
MKLFISYARVDKPLCKQIVHHLEDIHEVWYDRRLHAGQDWWQEIRERLNWCEGFVYLLSPESVTSEYCKKEYAIAIESGKHIFPVLIQARTQIPETLSHLQYANLSEGMEDIITLMNALTIAERRRYKRVTSIKPPVSIEEPAKNTSPADALGQAADAMEAENFDNAVFVIKHALEKKPSGRMERILRTLLTEADTALEQQAYLREAAREYAPILELVQRPATRVLGCEEFAEFQQDFPDYDPDNVAATCASFVQETPSVSSHSISTQPTSLSLMPALFKWNEIPGGRGTMKTDESGVTLTIPTERYWISKYPITNAQFAKFIEAEGYRTERWWTNEGWQKRLEGWHYDNGWKASGTPWTEPRYWTDSKWNGAEQPVVGVSWYEAVAFCLWLSETMGENIMLPTEDQWQYAAQGDDGRDYPWGKQWDASCCNNNVDKKGIGKTTTVRQYEGNGDSPFGVVDMAGNVWEWCLTDYDNKTNDINSNTERRVLRGGSWFNDDSDNHRCDFRFRLIPHYGLDNFGFRISRS